MCLRGFLLYKSGFTENLLGFSTKFSVKIKQPLAFLLKTVYNLIEKYHNFYGKFSAEVYYGDKT